MAAKTAINCQSGDSHNTATIQPQYSHRELGHNTATIQPQYSHRELGRLGVKGNNVLGGEKQGVTVAGGKGGCDIGPGCF